MPLVVSLGLVIFLLVETARIPFKRRHHEVFGVFLADIAVAYVLNILGVAGEPSELYFAASGLAFSIAAALIYHFILLFTNLRLSRARRYLLFFLYALAFPVWAILSFYAGYVYSVYYVYPTAVLILALLTLVQYYRTQESPLLRAQSRYLLAGILLAVVSVLLGFVIQAGGTSGLVSQVFASIVEPASWVVILVGLRKHGFGPVEAVAELPSGAPAKYNLSPGLSYLTLDDEPKRAFEIFSDLIQHGHLGLCITRLSPEIVRESYGLKTTPIRWLTGAKAEAAIAPSDLLGLSLTLVNFVQDATQPVVILHGIEYLVSVDEFKPVLKLIQRVNDVIVEKNGILILPLVPGSIGDQAQAQLIAECAKLPTPIH